MVIFGRNHPRRARLQLLRGCWKFRTCSLHRHCPLDRMQGEKVGESAETLTRVAILAQGKKKIVDQKNDLFSTRMSLHLVFANFPFGAILEFSIITLGSGMPCFVQIISQGAVRLSIAKGFQTHSQKFVSMFVTGNVRLAVKFVRLEFDFARGLFKFASTPNSTSIRRTCAKICDDGNPLGLRRGPHMTYSIDGKKIARNSQKITAGLVRALSSQI